MSSIDLFLPYALKSLGMVLGLLLAIYLVFRLLSKLTPKFLLSIGNCVAKWPKKPILLVLVIAVFLIGTVLYGMGYVQPGGSENNSLTYIILKSIMSSLEMFVSRDDFANLTNPALKTDPTYARIFGIIHFVAVAISVLYVTYLAVAKVYTNHRLKIVKNLGCIKRVYVFLGVDDYCIDLAKNLCKDSSLGADERVVMLAFPGNNAQFEEKQTIFTLLSQKSYNTKNIIKITNIKSDKLELVYANKRLNGIDFFKGHKDLASFLRDKQEVYFFSMSEDDTTNLQRILRLRNEIEINNILSLGTDVYYYCMAQRSEANMYWEDRLEASSKISPRTHVKLIDRAYETLHSLELDVRNHPINFVTPNSDNATVNETFKALIVGFGETGQNVLKFLYEYSSFVDDSGRKSPCEFYVVDRDLEKNIEKFCIKTPFADGLIQQSEKPELEGSFLSRFFNRKSLDLNYPIELINMDVDSKDFYHKLDQLVSGLNYIVLALNSDEDNIMLLGRIIGLYRKKGINDLSKKHICIRSSKREYEEILQETVQGFLENISNRDLISVFGQPSQVLTRGNLIENSNSVELEDLLKKEYDDYLRKNNKDRKNIFANKRRNYNNFSSALHLETKAKLIGKVKSVLDVNDIRFINLVKTEHLRWMSALYMMGYVSGDVTNEVIKIHSSLKDFDSLSDEDKEIDKKYVEIAMKYYLDKNK